MEHDDALVDAGEPLPVDPLTEQQMRIAEDRLDLLGASLADRRDEWIAARQSTGVEKRWLDDVDQYMGRDGATKQVASMMDSVQQGFPVINRGGTPQRSTVFINITRPKTNTAEARVSNMLLPTDDRNFGVKPSPTPDMGKASQLLARLKAMAGSPGADAAVPPGAPPQPAGAQQPAMPAMPTAPMAGPTTGPDTAAPGAAPVAAPAGAPTGPSPTAGAMPGPTAGPMPAAPGQPPGQPPAAPLSAMQQALAEHAKTQATADAAAIAMQDQIDGQFQACNWNAECRAMLHDAAVYGTGVLKGPFVVSRTTKTWQPMSDGQATVHTLEISSEIHPSSCRVSPWNVYPDPACGGDVRAGAGIFEKYDYTSKQLRELVNQPSFIKAQIEKVLADGPMIDAQPTEIDKRKPHNKASYTVWEYWGEFEPEDMRAAGVDVDDGHTGMVSGCIIMVNSTVIKGFLNPLDTGDVPYDFFPWEVEDDTPWGYGVPFMCRSAQRVLNAAWRQLMDNAGNSMGPQIILKPGIVQPADKSWTITGNKLWNCLDDTVDVRTAFASIDIQNHAVELENIIKLAHQFADEESMVPQLSAGEHGNAPDTVGGMTILMNSINVVLGRIAKSFDDRIIVPHVGRYIDWNMAYSDKSEIKGDHQVQARGTSALLVRDMQNQTLIQFGAFQGSGAISPMVNWENWVKTVLKAQHVDPTTILKSDQEIQALSSQASPPPIQIQVAQLKAQADQQSAQAKLQADMALQQARFQAEMQMEQMQLQANQVKMQNGELTPHAASATARIQTAQINAQSKGAIEASRASSELAYVQKEAQMAHDNNVAKLQLLQLQRDLAVLNYAQQHSLSLQEIRGQLAKTSMQEDTKRQLAAAELQLKANEGAATRLHQNITNEQSQLIE